MHAPFPSQFTVSKKLPAPTYVAGIQSNATKPIPVITMQEKTKEVVTDSSKIRERDI